jgi:Xaa-Pro aminopeptidase
MLVMGKSAATVSKTYQQRRRRLMQMMGKGSIAILPTANVALRNRDVEYPYRPDSDFFYLTGFDEPDAVIVLVPGRPEGEYILFCRERDPQMELWTGRRAGLKGARADFGADCAFPIGKIEDLLPGLLENRGKVYYTMGGDPEFDRRIIQWLKRIRRKSRAGIHPPDEIVSLEHLVHEMRLFKDREEIGLMRRAAQISAAAHRRAMERCRPGMTEYQLEAELIHEFMVQGARNTAYPPIVGGGANACVLHYTANEDVLKDGELVLIDAGAEYRSYAADITRTFPVGGRFSGPQREIYELVLEAQRAAIAKARPGNHWNDPHDAAVRVLTRGLVGLGLLKGDVRTLIRSGAYQRFFMHRTGHWLGMDVHDVGDYKIGESWRLLEPGMVLTVEPGLYVSARSGRVPRHYLNIGVRIEDDVLITKQGNEILSEGAPKTVKDIEAVMAN